MSDNFDKEKALELAITSIKDLNANIEFTNSLVQYVLDHDPEIMLEFIKGYPYRLSKDLKGIDRAIQMKVAATFFENLDFAFDEKMKDGKDYIDIVYTTDCIADQMLLALDEDFNQTAIIDLIKMIEKD